MGVIHQTYSLSTLAYEKACDIFNERTSRFLGGGWSSCVSSDEENFVTFTLIFFDAKMSKVYKIKHTDQIDTLAETYLLNSCPCFYELVNSIWMELFEHIIKHIEDTDASPHYDEESVTLYH